MTDIIEKKDEEQLKKIENDIKQQNVVNTPDSKSTNENKIYEADLKNETNKSEQLEDKNKKDPYNNVEYLVSKLSNNDELTNCDDFVYFFTVAINNANLDNKGKVIDKATKGALIDSFYKQINGAYTNKEKDKNKVIGVDDDILQWLNQLQPIKVNGKEISLPKLYKNFCNKHAMDSRLACAGDSIALLQAVQLNEIKFAYRNNPQKLNSINDMVYELLQNNVYNHINQDTINMLDMWQKENKDEYGDSGNGTARIKAYKEVIKEVLFCLVISNPVFLVLYIIKLILNKNTKDVSKGKGDQNLDNFTTFLNIKAIEDFINKAIGFIPDRGKELATCITEGRMSALKKITENNTKTLNKIRTKNLKKKFGDDELFDKITKLVGAGAERMLYADNNFREYIINKEASLDNNKLKQEGIKTENEIKQEVVKSVVKNIENNKEELDIIQKQLNEIKSQISKQNDQQEQQKLEKQQQALLEEEERIKKILEEEERRRKELESQLKNQLEQ